MSKNLPSGPLKIAVLGSSGAVGKELLKLLELRNFPIKELRLLSSRRSAGTYQVWKGKKKLVEEVQSHKFKNIDIVLASAGGSVSRRWRKAINDSGALLIDNSSAFRLDSDVPLVVPEVNPQEVFKHNGVIANPNCTTILLVLALAPLSKFIPIRRVIVSTYQSASGAGAKAMDELEVLTQKFLQGTKSESKVLPYSLAFNLFLHNSPLEDNGYCEEELKMLNETRKILNLPNLLLSATCVRVPVLRAHSESINIEFEEPFPLAKARQIITEASGVQLKEDFINNRFPMPIDVTGEDDIAVGRIRQDISDPKSLELWLCGDQIRKGAALNAVQIAELLVQKP